MAFKGLLTATIDVQGYLNGTLEAHGSILGNPDLNNLEVLDVADYFRTENNLHFLITENNDYLEI